jgi:hypothetical protein
VIAPQNADTNNSMAAVTLEDKSIWEDAEVSCLSKTCFLYVKCNTSTRFVKSFVVDRFI